MANNPSPSSSYFIETRYFSKIKALRRVDNNTLKKQEGLLGARREGREMDKGRKDSVCLGWARKPYPPEGSYLDGRSLQPEFSKEEK
jgi:hypothetical protein